MTVNVYLYDPDHEPAKDELMDAFFPSEIRLGYNREKKAIWISFGRDRYIPGHIRLDPPAAYQLCRAMRDVLDKYMRDKMDKPSQDVSRLQDAVDQ